MSESGQQSLAYTRDRSAAFRRTARALWPTLQEIVARNGKRWEVLGERRVSVLAARLKDAPQHLGSDALVLALEGYIARCGAWSEFHRFLTPESIYRPENFARNVEAGLEARAERIAAVKSRHAEEDLRAAVAREQF